MASLAVLTDDSLRWRPSSYGYELWGCRTGIEFPVVKLLDYQNNLEDLRKDPNPFAVVAMAHLQLHATRRDAAKRLQSKLALVRMLYERGYSKQDILELFRFIDWLLVLPEELEAHFTDAVTEYEEAMKMPYVTSVERVSLKRGKEISREIGDKEATLRTYREAIIEILRTRFGRVPRSLTFAVDGLEDLAYLKDLHKEAVTAPSVEVFEESLRR